MTASAETTASLTPTGGWTGRNRGGRLGNWVFLMLLLRVGIYPAYALLVPVALYFVLFAPRAAVASARFQKRAGRCGRSWFSVLWCVYRHFYCFGQLILDRVAIVGGRSSRFVFDLQDTTYILNALAERKGLILVSAHFGNWAAASHLLGRLGVPVSIVAYEGENAAIRRLFDRAENAKCFSIIRADGSADTSLAILAALRRGEIVAMHADRWLRESHVSIRFLGEPARFAPGPFVAAAVSGAPLIHAFPVRVAPFHYRLIAYPAMHLTFERRDRREALIAEWVGAFVERLEEQVRQHPWQWQNFYDFWDSGRASTGSAT